MSPLQLARLHQSLPVGGRATLPQRPDPRWLVGAGFDADTLVRLRTLPDFVGRHMRVLVCGLNPSLYSADAGVNFPRPGNRFWPAAIGAGLVSRDRAPWHALRVHRVGFTDLVKRATVGAAELRPDEFRDGAARVEWLVGRLKPQVVCFVGLTGWRVAIDRRASVGFQPGGFGGAAAYVMPNTSGLNARIPLSEFVAHFRAATAPPE